MSATNSPRAARSPNLTARVLFPAKRSVSMSRVLFTTKIAVAVAPTGMAATQASSLPETIPGLGGLLAAGVYRYTTMPFDLYRLYLPVILRGTGP